MNKSNIYVNKFKLVPNCNSY